MHQLEAPSSNDTSDGYTSPLKGRQPLRSVQAAPPPQQQQQTPTNRSSSASPAGHHATPTSASASAEKMRAYVLDSLRRHETLEAGQRRRIVSGQTPRAAASRLATPPAAGSLSAMDASTSAPGAAADGSISLRQQQQQQQRGLIGTTSGDGSAADSTPLHGQRRMDRLGKGNTFKAGRTPLVRRHSPLIDDGSTPSTSLREQEHEQDQSRLSASGGALQQHGAPSEASSNDLMAPVHGGLGVGNTSFPGLGAAEQAPPSGARVDPNSLNEYLSKQIQRLDMENAGLAADKEAMQKQLNKALRQIEALKEAVARNGDAQRTAAPAAAATAGGASKSEVAEMQLLLDELRSTTREQREEIEELQAQRRELEDLLDEQEAKVQELENRTGASDADVDGDRTRRTDLEDENHELHAEVTKIAEERDALQHENDQLVKELDERDERVQALEDELVSERQLHKESQQQWEDFAQQQVDAAEAAREQAQRFEEELRKLQDQVAGDAADRTATSHNVSTATHRANHSETLANAEMQLEQLVKQLEEASADLRSAAKREADLRAELMQVEQEKQHLAEDRDRAMEEQERAVEEDKAALIDERNELQAKCSALMQTVAELQEDLDEHVSAQSISSEHKAKGTLRDDGKLERERALNDTLADLRDVRELEGQVEVKETENRMLRDRIRDLEGRVEGLKHQNATAERSMAALTSTPHPKARTPIRTPHSPPELAAMSWLNHDSTLGGGSILRQLHAVQQDLDEKNAEVDGKMDQLEGMRRRYLEVHQNLITAEQERDSFKLRFEELWSARGPIERARRSLKRVACPECSYTIDASVKMAQVQREAADAGAQEHSVAEQSMSVTYKSLLNQLDEVRASWAAERRAWAQEKRTTEAVLDEVGCAQQRFVKDDSADILPSFQVDDARRATLDVGDEMTRTRQRVRTLTKASLECSRDFAATESKLATTERELIAVKEDLQAKSRELEQLSDALYKAQSGKHSPVETETIRRRQAQALQDEQRLLQERDMLDEERSRLFHDYHSSQEVRARPITGSSGLADHDSGPFLQRLRDLNAQLASCEATLKLHRAQIEQHERTIALMNDDIKAKDERLQQLAGDNDRLKRLRATVIQGVDELEHALRAAKLKTVDADRVIEQLRSERDKQSKILETERKWMESLRSDTDLALQRKTRALITAEERVIVLEAQLRAQGGSR